MKEARFEPVVSPATDKYDPDGPIAHPFFPGES
jgi:hypothetical protein